MSLNEDFELVFTSGTSDTLYVDPAEILELFPDASYIEAYEWVAFYSDEVRGLLDLNVGDEITLAMREYVRAAAACALSRVFDWSTGGGGSDAFSLGDLRVENRSNQRKVETRADATNWCELAGILRAELLGTEGRALMRSVVRSDAWVNPMPDRSLRHVDN